MPRLQTPATHEPANIQDVGGSVSGRVRHGNEHMDFCTTCQRHLNGAFSCPGCGAAAEQQEMPAGRGAGTRPSTYPAPLLTGAARGARALRSAPNPLSPPGESGVADTLVDRTGHGGQDDEEPGEQGRRRPRGILIAAIAAPVVVAVGVLIAVNGSPSRPSGGAGAPAASPTGPASVPAETVTLPAQLPTAPQTSDVGGSGSPSASATASPSATSTSPSPTHHPTGRPTSTSGTGQHPSPNPTKTTCFLFICG